MPTDPQLLDDLRWRGLIHQTTDEAALRDHLSQPRKAYVGFDPTSDSLTIGNLMGIVMLRRFQLAGHTPVVVMGGGTGMIGDPSGKSAERNLLTLDTVAANVQSQRRIFDRLLRFDAEAGRPAAVLVNNADWLGKLPYVEVLRDVGKHFSVNEMIKRDSVRDRIAREQGISYTEFSYMVLQAYDYLHLFRESGVTLQMGGSDQWGNILSGIQLIRRPAIEKFHDLPKESDQPFGSVMAAGKKEREAVGGLDKALDVHALTWPLVTKADGTKFGKTESGAVWLTADRTSPYAFHQFWLNTADADAVKFLKFFTLRPRREIEALEKAHAADPARREAHKALASHMTAMLHGEEGLRNADAAAQALFSGDVASLPLATLEEVFASVPASEHARSLLEGEGIGMIDLLAQTSLAKSKTEARQHLSTGAVTLNGGKVGETDRLTPAGLLHGSLALLRRGKKTWHVTRWR